MKLSKSRLALAKVINENGGWPIGADWSFQPKHEYGDVWFSSGGKKPIRAGDGFNHGCVDGEWIYGSIISHKSMIGNWHQTILSREEYYQAYPKADADGWIEWTSDELPVEKGTIIDVKYSDGDELHGAPCGEQSHHLSIMGEEAGAELFGISNRVHIIAYRLHKPEVKPDFCESVMRSIPEPKPFKCAYDPKLISLANVRIVDESIDALCAKVTEENKHQHVDAKPTIEQMAKDYRNKLDYANRKQEEADDAKAAADAALGELERAGEAFGLLIGIAKPEPELVITDWRDLQVSDIVFIDGMRRKSEWSSAMVGRECSVVEDGIEYPICFVNDFTP